MTHTPRHSEGRRTRAKAAATAVVNSAAMANPWVWWALAGLALAGFSAIVGALLIPEDIRPWATVATFLAGLFS